MTNQTLPSDANNRYKKGINTFENELRSIWLSVVAQCRTLIINYTPAQLTI